MDLALALNITAVVLCLPLAAKVVLLHRRVSALESKPTSKDKQSFFAPSTKGGVLQLLIYRAREEPSAERRERLYLEIMNRLEEVDDAEEKAAVRGETQGVWTWSEPDPIEEEEE